MFYLISSLVEWNFKCICSTVFPDFGNDDFVFKKPNLTSLPGRNQQMNKGQGGGSRQNNSGMSAPRSLMDGFNQGPERKTY